MNDFTTKYVNYTDCNGKAALNVVGWEMDLLTGRFTADEYDVYIHVQTPECFHMEINSIYKLFWAMFTKETFITFGVFGIDIWWKIVSTPRIPTVS